MPRRVAPHPYDGVPLFFGEGYEETTFGGVREAARDEFGRFLATTKVKDPTATINPPRPRTHRASYDPKTRTLRIQFRNGRVYGYYDVPYNIWRSLTQVQSTGRFINRRLDPFYEYYEEWPADIYGG